MLVMKKMPADLVIEKFGGHKEIAKLLGIDLSRVYKWTYDEDRGGNGGKVPSKHHETLLKEAQARGIRLRISDLFAERNEAA
jgi:hypothetical protein